MDQSNLVIFVLICSGLVLLNCETLLQEPTRQLQIRKLLIELQRVISNAEELKFYC